MPTDEVTGPAPRRGPRRWLPLVAVVALSAAYESLFLTHGLNPVDEGWPLYAAWGVERGGALYRDVLFVFPPGHLLGAWLGRLLDPPGIVVARVVYASFAVAAVAALYGLAARLLAPRFALLAAVLVAIAAPDSHLMHVIFGYRYLVFSIVALLLFDEWLRRDDRRWLFAAGLVLGVSACFRLEPAFAGCCGLGAGVLASERSVRRGLASGLVAAAGVLVVMVPVAAALSAWVGAGTLWREVVTRPAAMLALQSLPYPELIVPTGLSDRHVIRNFFAAVQFRAIWLLYGLYLVSLAALFVRARAAGRRFEHGLLVAVVVWGGVFFMRSASRSDLPHLESVIPPVCLLFVHAVQLGWMRVAPHLRAPARVAWGEGALAALLVAIWVGLTGTDLWLPLSRRGVHPIRATGSQIGLHMDYSAFEVDQVVDALKMLPPDATILDMSAQPILYVLSRHPGPGGADIVMPGSFLSAEEEERMLARVMRAPPAAVLWPTFPFDDRIERTPGHSAPQLTLWVREHYRPVLTLTRCFVMLPKRGAFAQHAAPETALSAHGR